MAKLSKVRQAITINRTADELYPIWRNFENLPHLIPSLKQVQVKDDNHSYWVAEGPANKEIKWISELVEDIPDQKIAWHSLEPSDINVEGLVEFLKAPKNLGTEVHVRLNYQLPAGVLGTITATLSRRNPSGEIADGLRCFKQIMELGRVPTVGGQPAGREEDT